MQFKGFVCVDYEDDGRTLLKADLLIDCESARYQAFEKLNIGLTALTQSIPLMVRPRAC